MFLMLPINMGALFIWQWYLNAYGYARSDWQVLMRLVDPFLHTSLLAMGVAIEGFDIQSDRKPEVRRFLRSLLPILIANTLLQLTALRYEALQGFASAFMFIALLWTFDRAYLECSHQPKVRYRLISLAWAIGMLVPLPIFRIFYLVHMVFVMGARQREISNRFFTVMKEYERERRMTQQIVGDITGSIQDFANLKESLAHFLQSLCKSVEAKAGAVYVWDENRQVFYCAEVLGYYFPLQRGNVNVFTRQEVLHEIALQQVVTDHSSLVWECGHGRKGLHLRYASQDPRVVRLGTRAANIQTLILEPLVLDQQLLGVLVIENKLYERYFSVSDAYLVRNFSHHATMILNTSRLSMERTERERVQMELNLGTRIQNDLLPDRIPKVEGISLAGSMQPAREIGGDYFDFIPGPEGRLGIVIGDVSGKGVPAGMIMTILQTLLHAQYQFARDTKDLLVGVNSRLAAKIKSHMFVTLLFFEWNPVAKLLRYTSCGHEHILHYRKAEGRLETMKSGGLALGMVEDNDAFIRERELPVQPGDTVLLYTDGIIEARNPEDQMFGLDRLKRFVESHQGMEVDAIHSALHDAMQAWRRDREPVDDITCIVMRF